MLLYRFSKPSVLLLCIVVASPTIGACLYSADGTDSCHLSGGVLCQTPGSATAFGSCGYGENLFNYGHLLGDLKLSQGPLSVIAVPSLAGGITSLQLNGHELFTTGGHGQVGLGYSIHPSNGILGDSECWNGNEVGSQTDDFFNPADQGTWGMPFLGMSSSAIIGYGIRGNVIGTEINMAYYLPRGVNSAFQNSDCAPYWYDPIKNPSGPVGNPSAPGDDGRHSGIYLQKWVTLGVTVNGIYFPNVLEVDGKFQINRPLTSLNVSLVS